MQRDQEAEALNYILSLRGTSFLPLGWQSCDVLQSPQEASDCFLGL